MKQNKFRILAVLLLLAGVVGAQVNWQIAGQTLVETWGSSAKRVFVGLTDQTVGDTYLTIPDFAGVVDEFTFKTKAQTMSNKTFVAPVLGVASATSLEASAFSNTTANGASWTEYVDSESITLATGAAVTDSTGNLLHANSIIDAVACKQTTAITTSTNWGISDPTTANRFAPATAIATLTLVGLDHHDPQGAAAANGPKQIAAAKLRITVTGSNPGAGVVRCSVFGRTIVAPTS